MMKHNDNFLAALSFEEKKKNEEKARPSFQFAVSWLK